MPRIGRRFTVIRMYIPCTYMWKTLAFIPSSLASQPNRTESKVYYEAVVVYWIADEMFVIRSFFLPLFFSSSAVLVVLRVVGLPLLGNGLHFVRHVKRMNREKVPYNSYVLRVCTLSTWYVPYTYCAHIQVIIHNM